MRNPVNVYNREMTMRVTIIATGGTIAKTYNEADGSLRFQRPVIESILSDLRLPDFEVTYQHPLSKDSLDITKSDRKLIVEAVRDMIPKVDAIIVIHGTDTLAETGELLAQEISELTIPIILTGAMRPYEFRDSDAAQNITEALLACRFVNAGIFVAMHNRVLQFPGVVKDRESLSFIKPN